MSLTAPTARKFAQRTVNNLWNSRLTVISTKRFFPSSKSSRASTRPHLFDLGWGTGACLARLSDAGFVNLTGVDRNVETFDAHELARFTPADLMNGDLAQLQSESFGLVTAIEVIEHVANPERIVEVAARCLAPRGWLMITTPNIYSIRARTRFLLTGSLGFFERQAAPDHISPARARCVRTPHPAALSVQARARLAVSRLRQLRLAMVRESCGQGHV